MQFKIKFTVYEVIEQLANGNWSLLDWATGRTFEVTDQNLHLMVEESEILN